MKNISHVASKIAKNKNINQDVVEIILLDFFKRIEKRLNEIETPYVRIEHIGLFLMKPKLINKQIRRNINILRNLPKKYWSKQTNEKVMNAVKENMIKLLKLRNEVAVSIFTHRMEKQIKNRRKYPLTPKDATQSEGERSKD